MDFIERTIDEDVIYSGKVVKLTLQNVMLPDGRKAKREIIRHSGGVAIIAFKDKDTVLLVEQYRKPIDKMLLEIPAGKIENGEDIEACGIRELEEETGYKSNKFTYLGKIVTSPGFADEYIYIYRADDVYKGRDDIGDADEFINIHEVSLSKIKEMIKNGEIIDAKTICAFMQIS